MMRNWHDIDRQGGAIAILVGLSAFVLFAFMGLALDLARTYNAKTELQNAADAAALAGAKRIDQTKAGIDNAVADAIAYAGMNQFGFPHQSVIITAADVMFGYSPTGPWFTQTQAEANPGGLSFVQVNTGTRTLNTLFMQIGTALLPNAIASTSTFGYAVAGPLFTAFTPIGICAINPSMRTDHYANGELLQYGFRRGMAYDVMQLGPLGNNSLPWLINPIDQNQATCNPKHSSATFTVPFVCMGDGALTFDTQGSGNAIGNTGLSNSVLQALNSRFGVYNPPYGSGQCDPGTAPPDANVMQYCYNTSGQSCPSNAVPKVQAQSAYGLDPNNQANWTINGSGSKVYQTVELNSSTNNLPLYNTAPGGTGTPNLAFGTNPTGPNNGVLWSYGPAYSYNASASEGVGAPFTPAQANADPQMYNNGTAMTYFGSGYPSSSSPYWQSNGSSLFAAPTGYSGVRKRRLINLLIIDCGNVGGSGACGQNLHVLGIGRFFMQVMVDPTGAKSIPVEYAGLLSPVPQPNIVLYQ